MDKADKYILLKITNKGVFYNKGEFIEWENTNFPPKDDFNFTDREEIFWKAKQVAFEKERSLLGLDVIDYKADPNYEVFSSQKPKFPLLNLYFYELKWSELNKVLNHYIPLSFDKISDSGKQKRASKIKDEKAIGFDTIEEVKKRFEIDFQHPLMKTEFKMGYVEIVKKFKGFPQKIKIAISNSNIIPEFDHVKPFFAKALGKKKIQVSGYAEYDEKGDLIVNCQSKEIDQIDEELIKAVKKLRLEDSVLRPEVIVVDKSVLTPEEYFEGLDDDLLGNREPQDLFKEILELEGIRNRNQLIYLSGKLQSIKAGLRFTLSPKFGFLFYVEGEKMDHFIWELLNTHATYIWTIDKEGYALDKKFELIEREINFIRDNGRRVYLSSDKSSDLVFNKVNHENSRKGAKDGFPKWKVRVNEKLV